MTFDELWNTGEGGDVLWPPEVKKVAKMFWDAATLAERERIFTELEYDYAGDDPQYGLD